MRRLIESGPNILMTFTLNDVGITQTGIEVHIKGCEWKILGKHAKHEQLIDDWMRIYCSKNEPTLNLPIDLIRPTFSSRVLRKLQQIPFGETTTYKDLAELAGSPRAARAVGNACGTNPYPLIIPCHRVLAAGNQLGGYGCGSEIKKELLAFEGHVKFTEN